jgi:hypothetical protein
MTFNVKNTRQIATLNPKERSEASEIEVTDQMVHAGVKELSPKVIVDLMESWIRAVSERSESTGPFPAHLHKIARRTIVTDTT